jgi:hypothetical protein
VGAAMPAYGALHFSRQADFPMASSPTNVAAASENQRGDTAAKTAAEAFRRISLVWEDRHVYGARNTFRTSSPYWLMTFTAILPLRGPGLLSLLNPSTAIAPHQPMSLQGKSLLTQFS